MSSAPDELLRAVEATLFAAEEPLTAEQLSAHLAGADVAAALVELQGHYAHRGIRLVEGDPGEFAASFGLSLNVLPTAPREVIAVAGFPITKAAMEAAGCAVRTFEADALCIACEGGPTCLTRPVLRG